jgi:hypothetical protein
MGDDLNYGASKFIATLGVFAGAGIAIGVPALILAWGTALGPVVVSILVIFAIVSGGFVATVAAFFGIVIPSRVGGGSRSAPPPAPAVPATPATPSESP